MFTETKTTTPVNKLPSVFEGISLRDYFSGQALIAILTNSRNDDTPKDLANNSYIMADAMLEARTLKPE